MTYQLLHTLGWLSFGIGIGGLVAMAVGCASSMPLWAPLMSVVGGGLLIHIYGGRT